MFFDKNSVKMTGNVVKVSKLYMTKHNHKYFAFITIAMHEAKHTTFAECQAWSKNAEQLVDGTKSAKKIEVFAHLGNGYDMSKHGDKYQKLVPVINKFKVISKKSSDKQAIKDSKNKSHSHAKTSAVASK